MDRLYFPLLGLLTVLVIAAALVFPQGLGDRSPGPFGHEPVQRTPAMKAAMLREAEAAQQQTRSAREAVADQQTRQLSPVQ